MPARPFPDRTSLTICFAHVAYRLGERFAARNTGVRAIEVRNLDDFSARVPEVDVVVVTDGEPAPAGADAIDDLRAQVERGKAVAQRQARCAVAADERQLVGAIPPHRRERSRVAGMLVY